MSDSKALSSRASSGIDADYPSATFAKGEARLIAWKVVTYDECTFGLDNVLYRYGWPCHLVLG
jgi:hypothetical protein